MIRKIKNSLSAKICILVAVLLMASSMMTYMAIVQFLPEYYSMELRTELDRMSGDMVKNISAYSSIEDAFHYIELFEAGAQVGVTILDSRGEEVWPAAEASMDEVMLVQSFGEVQEDNANEEGTNTEAKKETTADLASEDTEKCFDRGVASEMADDVMVKEKAEAEGVDKGATAVRQYSFRLGSEDYTMLVSGGMQQVNQAMEILYRIVPVIVLLALVTAFLLALLASVYLTAPIVRLSRTAKRMAALDFTDKYEEKRKDELGMLGRSLNELSANLSGALEELRLANEKLQSDIRRKQEIEKKRIAFFSAVSHELKTPITILKGHIQGMLQAVGAYRNRDYYLQRSMATTENMERMVQELLMVSRIENQEFTAKTEDAAELLRQQAAELTELIEQKGLEWSANIPEHLYVQIHAGRMEKVFRNLLMNAIRYTPSGKGNEIRLTMSAESKGAFSFSVENTGVHIPEEALPHLFDAFYRVEQSRSRETGGSGLGLYIVKMILDQHKANYRIYNTTDGVCFCAAVGKKSSDT